MEIRTHTPEIAEVAIHVTGGVSLDYYVGSPVVFVKHPCACSYQYASENKYYMYANVYLGNPKRRNTEGSPERITIDQSTLQNLSTEVFKMVFT